MKKTLFMVICAAFLASCASKAAIVDSAIIEAKTLQELAKVNNLPVPPEADSLIAAAKKQNDDRQTEQAFVLADEAVLRIHLSMVKQEQEILAAETKKAADSLVLANEYLGTYRSALQKQKNAPKERVIN
ncbi:MAG: hypothetical protein LBQ76_05635 [Candidatus Fibromonas sp.]|nr:hypothetical protein [Candidatus Fibromonas sp.]